MLWMLLMMVGCKAPPEAPGDLGDLSIYLFENFADEDPEVMAVGAENLEAFLLDLDLEADVSDRAFTLPILTPEHWGDIQGSDVDPEDQVPVAVAGESRHGLAENLTLVAETNHVCIESDTTRYYDREFLSDLDCFEDDTCDTVETLNEVLKQNPLATVWYDMYRDYRNIPLADGRTALFSRTWIEEVFPSQGGGNSWDQSYSIEITLPRADDPDRSLRYVAMWSSVSLTGIGDNAWAGLVRGGIDESFENADNFIDGELCGNDRDREYDRHD